MEPAQWMEYEHIDPKATRKRVESVLETARLYRQIGLVRQTKQPVSGCEQRLDGSTPGIHIVAESGAAYRADAASKLKQLDEELEQAIRQLDDSEAEIIRRRYLQREKEHDFLLCHELNYSERTYRRIKARAFAKLAYMLSLEVKQA